MAEKIGVIEEEYKNAKDILAETHLNILCEIERALKCVKGLNQMGGGFYLDEITPKVDSLVEELENIKKAMCPIYEMSSELVESFKKIIENYDTLG